MKEAKEMINTKNVANASAETDPREIDRSMMEDCVAQREDFEVLVGEVRDSCAHYLRKRPVIATSLVFLAGFYVGWKIKPW